MQLAGKTALVTGGATGIGRAIAESLAQAGACVAIAGRREEKLREAIGSWPSQPRPLWHAVDVARRDSVQALVHWAEAEFGRIDILINAAGVNFKQRTMADMPSQNWDDTLAINASGSFYCIEAVLPAMRARRDGLIVNISSVAGKRASALGGVAYSASKFAVSALSAAVALEVGREGVRVTNVCPGEVDTPILDARPKQPTPEQRAAMLAPEDVAAAVLMLACLPPRAHVAELIIKPVGQEYA